MQKPAYCSACGGRLRHNTEHALVCANCKRVAYADPKLAAASIVAEDNRILLVKRAIEPMIGKWSFPSGYVNRGEVVEDATAREIREETGLEVRVNWLVGLYSEADRPVVLAVYDASVVGGELIAGDETFEVGFFPLDATPELAFPHDDRILRDWRAACRLRARDPASA